MGGAVDLPISSSDILSLPHLDDNDEHIEQQIVKIYTRRVLFPLITAARSTLGTPRARAFV